MTWFLNWWPRTDRCHFICSGRYNCFGTPFQGDQVMISIQLWSLIAQHHYYFDVNILITKAFNIINSYDIFKSAIYIPVMILPCILRSLYKNRESDIFFLPITNCERWMWLVLKTQKYILSWILHLLNVLLNSYEWSSMFCISLHDDVIKWKHFPRYWPFVWGPRTKARDAELGCLLWSASE